MSASSVTRTVVLSPDVYSLDTIKKAAYRFLDRMSAEFELQNNAISCRLSFAPGMSEVTADAILRDFHSELLDQDLRATIARETAPLRNTILALAFAPTRPQGRA